MFVQKCDFSDIAEENVIESYPFTQIQSPAPWHLFFRCAKYSSCGFYANAIAQRRESSVLTRGVKRSALSVRWYAVHLLQHDRQHGIEKQRTTGYHYAFHHTGPEHSISVFESHQTAWRPGIGGIAGPWKCVRQMYLILIYLNDGPLIFPLTTCWNKRVGIVISD